MELVERELRKVKPVETPFIPYKNSLSVMLFSPVNIEANILNNFYHKIYPYHNVKLNHLSYQ